MIAADTSSLSAYFQGAERRDTKLVDAAFASGELRLPPVVLTELLSDPNKTRAAELENVLVGIGILTLTAGYWHRAGLTRRAILSRKLKCKTADALVAQACIDHNIALITHDPDFRHFEKYCGLKLA
jgi:predicted nucleic acid-binding protein